MNDLPADVKRLMALKLSAPDLINFCLTDKNTNKSVCDSNDFWRQKLIMDYPHIFDYYTRNKMVIKNPKNLYIRKFTEVYRMIEKFVDDEFVSGKHKTDDHEAIISVYKIKPEIKDDLQKTIYSFYNDYVNFPNIDLSYLRYDGRLTDLVKKYELRYFTTKDFEDSLTLLIYKLLKKDQMYKSK